MSNLVIVQLDGLSHPQLAAALARGMLPTLQRWLDDGTHRLSTLDSGLPSQTSSAQATLLFGVQSPPPGFRWYDRAAGHGRISRRPADVRHAATRWPPSDGLLAGGAAITVVWPAGAARRAFVLSDGARPSNARYVSIKALLQTRWPAGASGSGLAALVRGLAVAGFMDGQTTAATCKAIADGFRPVYATLLGYDQVAHHAGLDAPMTDWALGQLERALALIENATRRCAMPPRLVVLSDHGLSPGRCFADRHGGSLIDEITAMTRTTNRDWHIAPSGNLAHVYALAPASREAMDLLGHVLANLPWIGLVLDRNGVARGLSGSRNLATGLVKGTDPLLAFGAGDERAGHLAALAAHPDSGDLIAISAVDANGAVAPFENQQASHGGMGGDQTRAFALLPVDLNVGAKTLSLLEVRDLLKGGQPERG